MQSHCRFCGEQKTIKQLIDFSSDETIIQELAFINFKSEILPKSSCRCCYNSVQKCYKFFKKVKQTQILLKSIYENGKTSLLQADDIKTENDNDFVMDPVDSLVTDKNIDYPKKDLSYSPTNTEENNFITVKLNTNSKKKHTHFKHDIKIKKQIATNKKYDINSKSSLKNTINIDNTSLLRNSSLPIECKNNKGETSWLEYDWACMHCQAKFDSMEAVRNHSKIVHAVCFGFQCNYCTELFNNFNLFIEHTRQHDENLRLYCQFCNEKLATAVEALTHSINHWTTSPICALCGEMLPCKSALERHKKVYKKVSLPQRCYKKKPKRVAADISWAEYEWSCQDCSLSLPDMASLRAHTRDVHGKCFAMKCADCLTVMTNFKQFVDHVTAHRECLKNHCPYCNAKLNQTDLQDHISSHMSGPNVPCLGCGEVFPDSAGLMRHRTLYETPRFRGLSDTESLTCEVCLKVFPNGFQLRNHKVIHNEKRERDQICHTCGKGFFDVKTLTNHIKTHFTKTETCEICHKNFLTKQRLKVHISTHLELKQFVCNECGKRFRRKSHLGLHLVTHSAALPEQCGACGKRFRLPSYLKIHERQHTGITPYSCEVCNETFNHWGNCNRHMIRKHGVTFAKTKITAQGKLDVNRETGETKTIDIGGNAKEWCKEMLKPKKRGRKKKGT